MLNNTVLDIVIGLSFIFLLYSLMATALLEFIAGIFNYRPSMLQRGIEQMLDGKNYYYFWWERLANFVRLNISYRNYKSKENDSLHLGLINDYLPTKKEKIIPLEEVELTKAVFHSSEHRIVKVDKKFSGEDKKFSLKKIDDQKVEYHIKSDETGKILSRGKLDKKASLFSALIFNHPLYRHSAGNTRLSKEPTYLTADKFSDILIDILGRKMNGDTSTQPVLMKDIKKNISTWVRPNNADLCEILDIYVDQANGDLQRFRWLIEIWFNDQMERLTGWYKRQTSYLLFAIGLVLAVSFNIDSIEIVKKLEKNPDLAHKMADGATAYIKNVNTPSFNAENASKQLDTLYTKNLSSTSSIIGGWNTRKGQACDWTSKIVGFLATALAISFGSPFWFDLLSKLANLRAAGRKPEEEVVKNKPRNQSMQPDVNSFG